MFDVGQIVNMALLLFDSHLVLPPARARCADLRRHSPITSAQCVVFLVLTRPNDLRCLILSKTALLLCVLILGSWRGWHARFMKCENTKGWCGMIWGKLVNLFAWIRPYYTMLIHFILLSCISEWRLFYSYACCSGITASMDEIFTKMICSTTL